MKPRISVPGRVDPVFLMMLIAVILAVGSSIALRAVSSGMGPARVQAESPLPDTTAGDSIPSPHLAPVAKTVHE